ncbi:hypothetical protein [Exiguobacterium sp. SH5S4]|uniref:hypothetical protein n=1 Tax=Exiguobacterium sp. SH5S4 TaxID=2510961 RepID=UPI00137637BD|nr:hypothetical protein [Exiguobacterium sp. SH5S4]
MKIVNKPTGKMLKGHTYRFFWPRKERRMFIVKTFDGLIKFCTETRASFSSIK